MKGVDSINASAQNFESVIATSKATRSAAAQRGETDTSLSIVQRPDGRALWFPRRSPSPLLSPRRLLPRRPAALLPRQRAAAAPVRRLRLVLALHPVCFAVIPSPCRSYTSSWGGPKRPCSLPFRRNFSDSSEPERLRRSAIRTAPLCCYKRRAVSPVGAIPTWLAVVPPLSCLRGQQLAFWLWRSHLLSVHLPFSFPDTSCWVHYPNWLCECDRARQYGNIIHVN